MENEKIVDEVMEKVLNEGMNVPSLPTTTEVKPMNGLVVAGAAGGGLLVGGFLMWGIPKLIGAIKDGISKKKVEKKAKKDKKKVVEIEDDDLDEEEDQDQD